MIRNMAKKFPAHFSTKVMIDNLLQLLFAKKKGKSALAKHTKEQAQQKGEDIIRQAKEAIDPIEPSEMKGKGWKGKGKKGKAAWPSRFTRGNGVHGEKLDIPPHKFKGHDKFEDGDVKIVGTN